MCRNLSESLHPQIHSGLDGETDIGELEKALHIYWVDKSCANA